MLGSREMVNCGDDATAFAMKTSADRPRPTLRSQADGRSRDFREDLAGADGRSHSADTWTRFDGRRKPTADSRKDGALLTRPLKLHRGLGAVRRTELRARVREVTRHRVWAQVEALGDLAVR